MSEEIEGVVDRGDRHRVPGVGSGTELAQLSELSDLVIAVARRLRRARVAALEPYGLSPHQARAFMVVGRHCVHPHHPESCAIAGTGSPHPTSDHSTPEPEPELRLSALAQRLHIAPRSVTEVVDALEDRDLVRRQPSRSDRRATALHLTASGRALFEALGHEAQGAADTFGALSEAERISFARLLRKCT